MNLKCINIRVHIWNISYQFRIILALALWYSHIYSLFMPPYDTIEIRNHVAAAIIRWTDLEKMWVKRLCGVIMYLATESTCEDTKNVCVGRTEGSVCERGTNVSEWVRACMGISFVCKYIRMRKRKKTMWMSNIRSRSVVYVGERERKIFKRKYKYTPKKEIYTDTTFSLRRHFTICI